MFLGISSGDWLQAGASIVGALIAIWGVYWQVNKQNEEQKKSLERQLKSERKNSFDSSINVENYKYYVEFATKSLKNAKIIKKMISEIEIVISSNDVNNKQLIEISEIVSKISNILNDFTDESDTFFVIQKSIDLEKGTDICSSMQENVTESLAKFISLNQDSLKMIISNIKNNAINKNIFNEALEKLVESLEVQSKFYTDTSKEVMKYARYLIE